MSASIDCPHCGAPASVRTSRPLTKLVRQIYLACSQLSCGHTFAAQLEITHSISPSACPDPDIHLRQNTPRFPANDGDLLRPPETANDNGPCDEAVAEQVANGP